MENRREERVYGLKNLIIRSEDKEFSAVMTSISKTGVSVIIDTVLPTYKEILMDFEIENNKINVKGSVRWVNDHMAEPGSNLKEIGILFLNPPDNFIEYLDKILK
ncbi:MAG: PilZ domain-containing protein [Acidobacteriota bacterium]